MSWIPRDSERAGEPLGLYHPRQPLALFPRDWRLAGLSSALAFPLDLGARPLCRRLRGRGSANCQSLPQEELFVRQRERPGLPSQAVAWPPRLSAGRRGSGSKPGLPPASATLGRSSACDRSPPATPWVCPQLPLCSDHWTPCADADPDLLTMQTCQTDLKKSYWLRQGSFTHGSPLLFFNRPFPACPMFRLSKYDADHTLARDGVSREVPCSALKGETVPDSLPALTQSYSSLCNPTDCSPPGSSVPGISQARILECVAMPASRGSS